jgi:hypothetical protein
MHIGHKNNIKCAPKVTISEKGYINEIFSKSPNFAIFILECSKFCVIGQSLDPSLKREKKKEEKNF